MNKCIMESKVKPNETQIIERLSKLVQNIKYGSISIIKQDNVIIQINTNEKIIF